MMESTKTNQQSPLDRSSNKVGPVYCSCCNKEVDCVVVTTRQDGTRIAYIMVHGFEGLELDITNLDCSKGITLTWSKGK